MSDSLSSLLPAGPLPAPAKPRGWGRLVGASNALAIAGLAMRTDAPVLVLDDALSAVDVKTEQSILQHLHDVRQGKTTLIICHRLSAVETADQIIVLSQGEITEQGNHRALLQEQGWYRKMFDYQQLELAVEQGR